MTDNRNTDWWVIPAYALVIIIVALVASCVANARDLGQWDTRPIPTCGNGISPSCSRTFQLHHAAAKQTRIGAMPIPPRQRVASCTSLARFQTTDPMNRSDAHTSKSGPRSRSRKIN